MYPCEQLFERERLDQVVVGAELEAAQPVLDRVAGGQKDDRHIPSRAQLSRQLEPVAAGQEHVEHGEVGGGGKDGVDAGIIGEPGDGDPLALERARNRLPDGLLVLDEHHSWRVRAHNRSIAVGS
jgi:hypothetical protein